jgi:hypothetical protein
MDFLGQAFVWMGTHFTVEAYLVSTKVQGIVWSAADILLVFAFLRIAGLLRRQEGAPPIRWRFLLLAGAALLTPLLVFARTSRQIFLLESLVCGVQFLLLVATLVLEHARLMGLARELGRRRQTKPK